MQRRILALFLGLSVCATPISYAGDSQLTLADLTRFHLLPAPEKTAVVLKKGDRLAICGDSITEQKMYSRIMEDYITMCVPQLNVKVRQFGWSGERAPGFLGRMTNDCLRFNPTVATTCYGMNDTEYRVYVDRLGQVYRDSTKAIVDSFKSHNVRVVLGSPGCVGKMPPWIKPHTTLLDLESNLCELRNIDVEIANGENVAFADVFWPMISAGVAAQRQYGADYNFAGKDGVHPAWSGHVIMAYVFLKGLGLDGNIGRFSVDLNRGKIKLSAGHELVSSAGGVYEIKSSRYPYCACVPDGSEADLVHPQYPSCDNDPVSSDNTIVSGMSLVPFNQDLNRLVLVARNGKAAAYRVTWGNQTKTFTSDELEHGVNLAAEFTENPFCAAFARVDAAVAAKQAFETRQIKKLFRSPEAKTDMANVVGTSESERAKLVSAIKEAFVPVTYKLTIVPAD